MQRKRALMDWGYMSYLEGGNGDLPLVLIHGAGGNAKIWERAMGLLKDDFRIIALDMPGHGNSSCLLHRHIEDVACCLVDCLQALDLQGPILMGHSMGGGVVINAASRASQVRGLVLVGTGLRLEVNPKLIKGLQEDFLSTVETMARWCLRKEAPSKLVDEVRDMMLQAGKAILHADLLACSNYAGEESAGRLNVPTLVIFGDRDVMTPPQLSKELLTHIRGARLRIIPDSGHMVQLEQPKALCKAVIDWWRNLP